LINKRNNDVCTLVKSKQLVMKFEIIKSSLEIPAFLKMECPPILIKNRASILRAVSVCIVLLLALNLAIAQDEEMKKEEMMQEEEMKKDDYKAFNASAHLKNMHIWHGFQVHPGPVFATSIEYNTPDKKFTFGFWGGAGFTSTDVTNKYTGATVNANYKEVSIYTVYRFTDDFFVEAVSHNNFTGVAERGDTLHYWSYDKTQGYNFIDLNFGYTFAKNTSLYLAKDGSFTNSWTHYLELKSKVWEKDDFGLSLFAAGAWSFVTDKTFYTEGTGNLINVGASLSKGVKLGNWTMPTATTLMWNPEKEIVVIELDLTLF